MEFDNNFEGMETQGNEVPENFEMNTGHEDSESTELTQTDTAQEEGNLSAFENNFQDLYRTQLEEARNQYKSYYDIVGQVASQYGMTPEQYIEAVNSQQQDEYKMEQAEQAYNSLDPQTQELVSWVKEQKEAIEAQRLAEAESQALTNELKELMNEFPEITPNEIPDEVYKDKIQNGIPLVYSYARYARQAERKSIEQQTINNLKANQNASVGSLNNPSVDMKMDFDKMDKSEFNALVEKVKRGQITNF